MIINFETIITFNLNYPFFTLLQIKTFEYCEIFFLTFIKFIVKQFKPI